MTLEEKGLDYEIIEENLSEPSAELLRLHPQGLVPLLIHNGVALHESSVITEYLEDAFPTPSLRPREARAIAEMRLWTHWCNMIFKPDLDALKYAWAKTSKPEQEALTARLAAHLRKLVAALHDGTFLMGRRAYARRYPCFPLLPPAEKGQRIQRPIPA